MKKTKFLVILLMITCFLLGCVAEQNSVTKNADTLSEDVKSKIVGTYVGENGSGLTLFSDGTASYYWKDMSSIETGDTWQYSDNQITWYSKSCMCNIYGPLPEGEGSEIHFKSNSFTWDDEKYKKVDSLDSAKTISEYTALINTHYPKALGSASDSAAPTSTPKPTSTPAPTSTPVPTPTPKIDEVTVTVKDKTSTPADINKGRYSASVRVR